MFESTPVVKKIFYINVFMFLLTLLIPSVMYGLFALNNPYTIYQFITYQFMHGGFIHIFFNMLVFLSFAPAIENIYGGRKMLIYYLICGVVGALLQIFMTEGDSSQVGASAAIWGIMVIFTLFYPNQEMNLMFIPIAFKAKWIIGLLFASEVICGFVVTGDNVGHFGHVGGGLTGALLYYLNKKKII